MESLKTLHSERAKKISNIEIKSLYFGKVCITEVKVIVQGTDHLS